MHLAKDKSAFQVFSSNDTWCRQAERPLYPNEKSDKAKYDDDNEKNQLLANWLTKKLIR